MVADRFWQRNLGDWRNLGKAVFGRVIGMVKLFGSVASKVLHSLMLPAVGAAVAVAIGQNFFTLGDDILRAIGRASVRGKFRSRNFPKFP